MDNHNTADKHKTLDGFPIKNCVLRASQVWTASEFLTTDRTEFPLLLHHTKSASLNGHSLTHIKIYGSDNLMNQEVLSWVHRDGG